MKRTPNRYPAMLKIISLSLVVFLFSACAKVLTREDASAFTLLQEGKIPPKNSQAFTDCLMDGFDKAHFRGKYSSRQQRRSGFYRVESLGNGVEVVVSADIFDDGRVLLYELTFAALIDTSGERDSFQKCLSQYGI